jgi:uncharacterized protein (TIGR02265 family)
MAAASRGHVKGAVLQSRLALLRERGGEEAVHRVLARLTEEDRRSLTSVLLASGWYPFELNERLDRCIAEEVGKSDGAFRMLGAASATHNLGAVHRNFVTRRDPHGLLRQAATIFRLYYDTGRREYERTGDKSAVLRTYDCASFSRADCLTVVGWHEKAIELCGGRKVHVYEPHCRARGDAHCEYVCSWE